MIGHLKEKYFIWHHKNQIQDLHRVLWLYTIVFLVWGLYRRLFPVHVWIEETLLKFLVFGLPVFWVVLHKEGKTLDDLGMRTKGLIVSIYFGLLFGLWLAVFGNLVSFVHDGSLGFNPTLNTIDFRDLLVLGLFTAFWEQLFFSGYMLPRIVNDTKKETLAVLVVSFLFALLHMPVQIISGVGMAQLIVRFILLFTLQFGGSVLFLRFKNLAAPIFAHLGWGAVIFLFG